MIKYKIVHNDYKKSLHMVSEIRQFLGFHNAIEDIVNPQYIIVVGGDGTVLKAVNEFQDIIDEVIFVVINSGSLGFYAGYNQANFKIVLENLVQHSLRTEQISLLEVNYNWNAVTYVLNEIKVINQVRTIQTNVYINDELLEHFRGSGLIFSTATGSCGYMRAINGAIIATKKYRLWELKELAPIANSVFTTINSPMILDDSQVVRLEGGLAGNNIIIDTYLYDLKDDGLTIKLSDKSLNLAWNDDFTSIEKFKKLFSHNMKRGIE